MNGMSGSPRSGARSPSPSCSRRGGYTRSPPPASITESNRRAASLVLGTGRITDAGWSTSGYFFAASELRRLREQIPPRVFAVEDEGLVLRLGVRVDPGCCAGCRSTTSCRCSRCCRRRRRACRSSSRRRSWHRCRTSRRPPVRSPKKKEGRPETHRPTASQRWRRSSSRTLNRAAPATLSMSARSRPLCLPVHDTQLQGRALLHLGRSMGIHSYTASRSPEVVGMRELPLAPPPVCR